MKDSLNLGCGRDIRLDCVNLDVAKLPGVDVVHDLNESLTFKDCSFRKVISNDVIEHVNDPEAFMLEIQRVLKKGGTALITTPHYSSISAYVDPQHKHYFSAQTADFWVRGNGREYYAGIAFEKVNINISFYRKWYLPHNYILQFFVNSHRKFLSLYEQCFVWIFPADEITWVFTK